MITKELLYYIIKKLEEGFNKEWVKSTLMENGWQEKDIGEAFEIMSTIEEKIEAKNISSLKDKDDSANYNENHKQKKTKEVLNNKLLLTVALFVIIFGASYNFIEYFNYYYFQTPEDIAKKAISNLNNTKSFEYYGDISTTFKPKYLLDSNNELIKSTLKNSIPNNAYISFSGLFNTDKDKINKFNFTINTYKLSQAFEKPISIETRKINDLTYLKINSTPSFLLDFNGLKDYWIKYNMQDINNKTFILEKLGKQIKEIFKKQNLSLNTMEKFQTRLLQANILSQTKYLNIENINGIYVYHYKFNIDKENTKKLLFSFDKIGDGEIFWEDDNTLLDLDLNAIEFSYGEIWIDKNNLLPHKLMLSIKMRRKDSIFLENMDMAIHFKNFNKNTDFEIPKNSYLIDGFMEELLPNEFKRLFAI